jgi:hypothetical protein
VTNEEYPQEITKGNRPKLVENAKKTKRKADLVMWSTTIIYSVASIIVLFFGFPLWGYFVIATTSPPMSPQEAFWTIVISFIVLLQMVIVLLLFAIESAMNRVFHLNYKDWVFGECVLISDYMSNNEKVKAVSEVDNLSSSIRGLLWNSRRNSRSKMLSSELKTLENGSKSIKRMLLFSTQDTVGMLTRFALAFVHNQDATTFSTLKDIINEANLFGEMKSLTQRVLGRLEKYPTVVYVIWAVISTIISIILAILLKINA